MKHISNRAYWFLEKLGQNNNRIWFAENKPEYLDIKKEIEIFASFWHSELMKIDTSLQDIDVKPYLFRIYRDARFAKGRPFKQNYGILLVEWGKPAMHQRAGYYLNIEPGNCFLVWWAHMPEPVWLKNIRNNITENSAVLKNILSNKKLQENFILRGSQLKTAPRGFAKDHPELDLLRYKSMYLLHNFEDSEVLQENFLENLMKLCKILHPFDQYLNKHVQK